MKYYKFLNARRRPIYGTGIWSLPKNGKPGEWMPFIKTLIMCRAGYHVCTEDHLIKWIGQVLWEVDVKGEHIADTDKLVFQQARLIRKIDTWNARSARLLAADFAEHVLHFFEKLYPGDDRPRKAIIAARKYAYGKLTSSNLSAAESAARSAAENVAESAARSAAGSVAARAAWSAARSAAMSAAWSAAEGVAGSAAESAARSAAWSAAARAAWSAARSAAMSAAWSAAEGVAGSAAESAARSAAWSAAARAERKWQSNRLIKYLRL